MLDDFKQIRNLSDTLTPRQFAAKAVTDVNDTMQKLGEGIERFSVMTTDGVVPSSESYDQETGFFKPITRLTDSGAVFHLAPDSDEIRIVTLPLIFETWAEVYQYLLDDGSWYFCWNTWVEKGFTAPETLEPDVINELIARNVPFWELTREYSVTERSWLLRIYNSIVYDGGQLSGCNQRIGYEIRTGGGNGSTLHISTVYFLKQIGLVLRPLEEHPTPIVYVNPENENWDNEFLDDLATNYGVQYVLSLAMEASAEGNSTTSDLAARLNTSYASASTKVKSVIDRLVAAGSHDMDAAAMGMKATYSAMSSGAVVDDGHIEWGESPTPVIDFSIGSVFLDLVLKAGQVLGSVLLFAGGLIGKLAGAVITLVSTGVSAILQAEADAMDTFPDIEPNVIDQLVGYPMINKGHVTLSESELNDFDDSIKNELIQHKCCKVINPFYIIFLYNYDPETYECDVKMFMNVSVRGYNSAIPSFLALKNDGTLNPGFYSGGALFDILINSTNDASGRVLSEVKFDIYNMKYILSAFTSGVAPFGPLAKLNAIELVGEGKDGDNASYGNIYLACLASAAMIKMSIYIYRVNPQSSDQVSLNLYQGSTLKSWNDFNISRYSGTSFEDQIAFTNAMNLTTNGYTVGPSGYRDLLTPIELWALLHIFEVSEGGAGGVYNILSMSSILPNGAYVSGHDYYQEIIHKEVEDLAAWLEAGPYGSLSMSVAHLCKSSLSTGTRWLGVDTKYCIRLPERSWKSVVLAQILMIAAIAGTILLTVGIKSFIRRKAQPWVQKNINDLEEKRDAIKAMEKQPDESDADFMKRKDNAVNALYKQARRFNLKARILGMGSFDVAAGFWDGSTVVGGNWSVSPASIGEGDGGDDASPLSVIRKNLADSSEQVEEVGEQVSSTDTALQEIKQLLI